MKPSFYLSLIFLSIVCLSQSSCSGTTPMTQADRAELQKNKSLDERLGRVSGVTVTGTGANARVRIRGGNNSFGGSAEPLFVLNGQQLSGYQDAFANVDPKRIKSIKVLKGADAASYGARGGAGVVLIDTY